MIISNSPYSFECTHLGQMIIVIDDAYHGVGSEIDGIHMSCRFSLRRDGSASRKKCFEMLKMLCESIMERVDETYTIGYLAVEEPPPLVE